MRRFSDYIALDERGGAVGSLLTIAGLLFILILLPYFLFGKVVPPNMIGVRVNHFGLGPLLPKGYGNFGLEPGLHWQLPVVSSVYLLPRNFQFVNLNDGNAGGNYDGPPVYIPTTDGSKINTDVTLIVRLFEGAESGPEERRKEVLASEVPLAHLERLPHGGPENLVNAFTFNLDNVLGKFAETAQNQLKITLSQLSTTDFYDPAKRERAALEVNDELGRAMAPKGIQVWGTLIRRYLYAEKKIDDQIFAKNLQEQTERMNKARSDLSAARAETEKQRANWDAQIRSLEVEGEAKVRVTESQGRLEESKRVAAGDLAVAQARATIDSAKATLLADAAGADNYIARQMAPLLGTVKGGVLSAGDALDIESWTKKLSGGGERQ